MQKNNLNGKIAVITGASSGIGEATARLLVEEGAIVVLAARRRDRLEAIARELGGRAIPVVTDVTRDDDVKALFDVVRDRFGGMDLLFNNAGIGVYGPFADSSPQDWRAQIDLNIYAVLACTHWAIPLLADRPGAMISTVSSVAGRDGMPNLSVYSATKFAVVGLSDALRKELWPRGIRVSVIEPGLTWTDWGDNIPKADLDKRREAFDALRPDDVAQALVYAFVQPANVLVEEILLRPNIQG